MNFLLLVLVFLYLKMLTLLLYLGLDLKVAKYSDKVTELATVGEYWIVVFLRIKQLLKQSALFWRVVTFLQS